MGDPVAQFGRKMANIALEKSVAYRDYLKTTSKSGLPTATAADPGACGH